MIAPNLTPGMLPEFPTPEVGLRVLYNNKLRSVIRNGKRYIQTTELSVIVESGRTPYLKDLIEF